MPRPRNDPALDSKPLPVPLPFFRGHFGGTPFQPRSLHCYHVPGMPPVSSQKVPPSPSPSPGAGTGKGAPISMSPSVLSTSEILDNLPGQFSLSGQIFCTGQQDLLRGLVNFKIKSLYHFLPSFLCKKW